MRPDPAQLVARWHGSPHTLTHVGDGANAVYTFRTGSRLLILRLTEDSHRSRCQLEAELDFVRFVAARGVAAAPPIPSDRDAWVETVQPDEGEPWHAVAFMAVPGRHFRFFSGDIDRPLQDQRMRNVWFDATVVVRPGMAPGELQQIAARIRQIGVERVLYGSDAAASPLTYPGAGWTAFRQLPLTEAEFRVIANNVAPYMRD